LDPFNSTPQTASRSVSCLCTAYGRQFLYLTMGPLPQKLPIFTGDLDSHLIHCSLGQPEFTAQTVSRSVQPFLQVSWQSALYRPFLQKLSIPMGIWTPSNTWFLGPIESSTQTFCSAHYCDRQTDPQTDRLTEHATRSVTIGRIFVHSFAMRPKKTTSEIPLSAEDLIVVLGKMQPKMGMGGPYGLLLLLYRAPSVVGLITR